MLAQKFLKRKSPRLSARAYLHDVRELRLARDSTRHFNQLGKTILDALR